MQRRLCAKGFLRVEPDSVVVTVPVADGGDGTLETLVEGSGGQIHQIEVTGPLGERTFSGVGCYGRWGYGSH